MTEGETVADRRRRPASPPLDETSVDWGWHGEFPRGLRVAGLLSVVVLVGLMLTTHDQQLGRMPLLWIAAVIVIILLGLTARRRRR